MSERPTNDAQVRAPAPQPYLTEPPPPTPYPLDYVRQEVWELALALKDIGREAELGALLSPMLTPPPGGYRSLSSEEARERVQQMWEAAGLEPGEE